MTIAAHIDTTGEKPSFLLECMHRLASQNTHHQFVIFREKESQAKFESPANCRYINISPEIKNSLLLHYWYNFKLPSLLRKINASVFISENNVCSLRCNTPQLMVARDNFLWPKKYPANHEYRRYLKKYFSKFADKATMVCLIDGMIGKRLFAAYPVLKQKSTTILAGINSTYKPITTNEKEIILQKYTGGNEFFICECTSLTQPNLKIILKAFSIFKKRLKSGMQLLILNKMGDDPIKDFHSYKYRQEVQIIKQESIQLEATLIAASYAGIYIPEFLSVENLGLNYMKSHVPFLTISNGQEQTVYKDAAIYTEIDDKKIAEYLMLLYKDETYRNIYIQRGAGLASQYNMEESSAMLWQTILQCSGV